MKASAGAGDFQISQFDPSRPSVFFSPHDEADDDDPLIKSVEHSFDGEEEHGQLDHLISQLALCAPAPNASFDELQSFRKILLEAARAVSMRSRFLDRLRCFALTDDLTGLYNRRGFLVLGVARFDPQNPVSLGELLSVADREMFERKRVRVSRVQNQGDRSS